MGNNPESPLRIAIANKEVNMYGELVLDEAGSFTFLIPAYEEALQKLKQEQEAANGNQNKLNDIKNRKQQLNQQFANVRYIWQVVGYNLSLTKDSFNETFGKGYTGPKTVRFEKVLEGGGKCYLEAYFEGENPKQKAPEGIFVSATGKPGIIRTIWTDCENKVITPDDKVLFGSTVLLHIYTEALYGQEIEIKLWDRDIFSPNDELTVTDPTGKTGEKLNAYSYCEVNIHKFDPALEAGLAGHTSMLMKSDQDKYDNLTDSEQYVQKAIIQIYVSDLWKEEGGKELKVYPLVARASVEKLYFNDFERNYLHVVEEDGRFCPPPKNGLSPAKVFQVETNINRFQPCKYTKVHVKETNQGNTIFDDFIFDEKKPESIFQVLLDYPLVAGVQQAMTELEVQLDTDTNDCLFEDNPERNHKDHVVNLSLAGKMINNGWGEATGKYRLVDIEEFLKNCGLADGEVSQNDGNLNNISHIFDELTIRSAGTEIKLKEAYRILEDYQPFNLKATDNEIKIRLGYDYSHGNKVDPFIGLIASIWPNNKKIAQCIPIVLDTCRYTKPLNIWIYPDTKWILQLGLNYDADKLNLIQEAYHDSWKLKKMEAEEDLKLLKLLRRQQKGSKYQEEQRRKREKIIQAEIDEANRRTSGSGRLGNLADDLELDDALEHDILNLELGLICEFDRPSESIEIKSVLEKFLDFIKKIARIKEEVDNIIEGTNKKSTASTPTAKSNRLNKLKEKMEEMKKKKKPSWSFEFIPPKIGLSIGWYAEHPKDIQYPVVGTMIEGIIEANPLMGFEVKYDIFQLLANIPHPVVKGVVLAIRVLDDVLGDNFDIILDFVVSGELYIQGQGTFCTIPESSYRKRLEKDENDSPFTIGGKIDIGIKARIKGSASINTAVFGKYEAYGRLTGDVKTGITCEGILKALEEGLYVEPEIKFHGIIMSGTIDLGIVEAPPEGENKDLDERDGVRYSKGGEVVVMDAYEWELAEWRIPIIKS